MEVNLSDCLAQGHPKWSCKLALEKGNMFAYTSVALYPGVSSGGAV